MISASHPNHLADRRRFDRRGPSDQRDPGAAFGGFGCDRKAHASAGAISHESDRVDIFQGRSGGNQHARAAEGAARRQSRLHRADDFIRLGEAPLADPTAGQIALARLNEADAPRRERVEVLAHRLVRKHLGVHRRRQQHRRTRGGIEGREEIIGDAVGQLADDVRGRGRNQQQVD